MSDIEAQRTLDARTRAIESQRRARIKEARRTERRAMASTRERVLAALYGPAPLIAGTDLHALFGEYCCESADGDGGKRGGAWQPDWQPQPFFPFNPFLILERTAEAPVTAEESEGASSDLEPPGDSQRRGPHGARPRRASRDAPSGGLRLDLAALRRASGAACGSTRDQVSHDDMVMLVRGLSADGESILLDDFIRAGCSGRRSSAPPAASTRSAAGRAAAAAARARPRRRRAPTRGSRRPARCRRPPRSWGARGAARSRPTRESLMGFAPTGSTEGSDRGLGPDDPLMPGFHPMGPRGGFYPRGIDERSVGGSSGVVSTMASMPGMPSESALSRMSSAISVSMSGYDTISNAGSGTEDEATRRRRRREERRAFKIGLATLRAHRRAFRDSLRRDAEDRLGLTQPPSRRHGRARARRARAPRSRRCGSKPPARRARRRPSPARRPSPSTAARRPARRTSRAATRAARPTGSRPS